MDVQRSRAGVGDSVVLDPVHRRRERVSDLIAAARPPLSMAGPVLLVFLVQQVVFPVPAGVFLRGIIIGLLTAMVSVGMALIYRANRVLNFAQGDLGYVPASLAVMLVISTGVPWLLAFGAGFAAAAALGAVCELAVIRRFFRARA